MSTDPAETTLLRELLAAVNTHDVDRAAECYAEAYRGVDLAQMIRCDGRGHVRRALSLWITAFPDLAVSLDDVLVDAPRAAVRWSFEGTHRAPFMRVPPTHRRVATHGFSLLETRDGSITRAHHLWDMAAMLRAMKLLPELRRAGATPEGVPPRPPDGV